MMDWESYRKLSWLFIWESGIAFLHHDISCFPRTTQKWVCTKYIVILNCISFFRVHKPQCTYGGQRTTYGNQCSPSTIWVLRIELMLSGLAACTFFYYAMPLSLLFLMKEGRNADKWPKQTPLNGFGFNIHIFLFIACGHI